MIKNKSMRHAQCLQHGGSQPILMNWHTSNCKTKDMSMLGNYHITINPTLDCNLKCWYCSVDYAGTKHNRERMSNEMVMNTDIS